MNYMARKENKRLGKEAISDFLQMISAVIRSRVGRAYIPKERENDV